MIQDSSEQNGCNEKIGVADHQITNGMFKYEANVKKSDSFIVDLESFSNVLDKESTANSTATTNSRITLQRSLSRKLPQRGAERKIIDRDPLTPCSSPRAAQGVNTPDQKSVSPPTLPMGSPDHYLNNNNGSSNQFTQHQITIKTGGVSNIADGRWCKRPSFKRSPASWLSDPKRILLFFATLSSMGTILLIYFTLSMSKSNEKEGITDWQ